MTEVGISFKEKLEIRDKTEKRAIQVLSAPQGFRVHLDLMDFKGLRVPKEHPDSLEGLEERYILKFLTKFFYIETEITWVEQNNIFTDRDLIIFTFQGMRGADGDVMEGRPGRPGNPGKYGLPGIFGDIGKEGEAGVKGEPGFPGLQGEVGNPGRRGMLGVPGREGSPGANGKEGLKGIKGLLGEPGSNGQPGMNGQPGKVGSVGKEGAKGRTGSRGRPGMEGVQGRPGSMVSDSLVKMSILNQLRPKYITNKI